MCGFVLKSREWCDPMDASLSEAWSYAYGVSGSLIYVFRSCENDII
jgi:hypothetical protein